MSRITSGLLGLLATYRVLKQIAHRVHRLPKTMCHSILRIFGKNLRVTGRPRLSVIGGPAPFPNLYSAETLPCSVWQAVRRLGSIH